MLGYESPSAGNSREGNVEEAAGSPCSRPSLEGGGSESLA